MSSSNSNAQKLEMLYSIIESIIQDKKPTENKLDDFNCKWSPEAIAAFTNLLFSHLSIYTITLLDYLFKFLYFASASFNLFRNNFNRLRSLRKAFQKVHSKFRGCKIVNEKE